MTYATRRSVKIKFDLAKNQAGVRVEGLRAAKGNLCLWEWRNYTAVKSMLPSSTAYGWTAATFQNVRGKVIIQWDSEDCFIGLLRIFIQGDLWIFTRWTIGYVGLPSR